MYLETAVNATAHNSSALFAFPQALVSHPGAAHGAAPLTLRRAAGEVLFSEGDESEGVYEVTSGTLRLYKLLPDGRRQITGFVGAGDHLGLADGVWVYTAEAITPVTLRRYNRSTVDRLIDEVPGFARRVLAATSQELRVARDQMLLLGRKSAIEKVASFLVMIADQQARSGRDELALPMTRNDIADYLGLTIETVSRTLSKLKQEAIIALPAAVRIEILDRDRLEELAAGDDRSC